MRSEAGVGGLMVQIFSAKGWQVVATKGDGEHEGGRICPERGCMKPMGGGKGDVKAAKGRNNCK